MVNAVETRFYQDVVIDHVVVDIDIHTGASVHGCINSGRLTFQNNRTCFTEQFSAEFFRGHQQKRSAALTATSTSTSKRMTPPSTTVLLEIDLEDCTTKIINDEFAFIINKWFNNSFVVIDLRSSPLHILSSMITHLSIERATTTNVHQPW